MIVAPFCNARREERKKFPETIAGRVTTEQFQALGGDWSLAGGFIGDRLRDLLDKGLRYESDQRQAILDNERRDRMKRQQAEEAQTRRALEEARELKDLRSRVGQYDREVAALRAALREAKEDDQ